MQNIIHETREASNVAKLANDNADMMPDVLAQRWRAKHRAATICAETIVAAVCEYFRVGKSDLIGDCRCRSIVLPRFAAMFLLREWQRLGVEDIGKVFSRDHSTVVYAVNKSRQRLLEDHIFAAQIDELKRILSQ